MLGSITRSEHVIIVEDDRVRSVVIGPRQRLKPALFIALALSGVAVITAFWVGTYLELRDARAATVRIERGAAELARQLDLSREQVAGLTAELGNARSTLDQAKADRATESERLAAILATLNDVPTGRATAEQLKALRSAVAAVRTELGDMIAAAGPSAGNLSDALALLANAEQAALAMAERGALADAAAAEVAAGDAQPTTAGLARALAETQAEVLQLRTAMGQLTVDRDAAAARMAEAEQRMQAMTEGQVALLARLAAETDTRNDRIASALRETGIDLESALAELETERFGRGGPLVGLGDDLPAELLPPAANEAMAELESRLTRQAQLRALATLLPLAAPVDNFYVSSGYGRRRDPFTKQWALHGGLDLVAQYRAPVTSTAPGTVTDVGWDAGYGRVVLLDHGFGIRTRYAHLDKVLVKPGDQVGYGQQIGLLGSSGRSSGPHLHYEVIVEGRSVDPLRFMEKGRHVCEG